MDASNCLMETDKVKSLFGFFNFRFPAFPLSTPSFFSLPELLLKCSTGGVMENAAQVQSCVFH